MSPPPNPNGVGWHSSDNDNANIWVDQSYYKSPDFVCGRLYNPGASHAKVAAGGQVVVQWYGWAPNHRGPILDYLANCNGPCDKVDKARLRFVKVAEMGLVRPLDKPNAEVDDNVGFWATDVLFDTSTTVEPQEISPPDKVYGHGPTWTIRIPPGFPAGYYVLRHEIIALFAGKDDTQHYPRCINLDVTGDGRTETPQGVLASELYTADMPGIIVRTWEHPHNYTIPGPQLYKGGNSSQTKPASTSTVTTSSDSQESPASASQSEIGPSTSTNTPSARTSLSSIGGSTEANSLSVALKETASPQSGVACLGASTSIVVAVVTVTVVRVLSSLGSPT